MKNSKTKITLDDLFAAHQSKPLTAKERKLISEEIRKYKNDQTKKRVKRKSPSLAL